MFGLTKYILLISCLHFTFAQDFFDYSEVGPDNPLAYLWNNRNNLVQDNRASCTVSNNGAAGREGSCMNAAQCRFNRGKAIGRGTCSFWNTCCVFEKTSNQTSDARVTYFVNPSSPRALPQNQRMYVKLANKNVCQMRIDIISLQLEPAVINGKVRSCSKDNFFIEPAQREMPVPEICGTNNNQHFYVHLTPNQILNNAIILNVQLDTTSTGLVDPRWDIKVSQLECATRQRPFDLQNKENRNQAADDASRLAPSGCLQYYTEPSGTIKSFGYVSPTSSILNTNQDYAICFKRLPNSCGVNLETKKFLLRTMADKMCLKEYLYVPETSDDKVKYCEVLTPPAALTTAHPGPLYVHFHSDRETDVVDDGTMIYGFEFDYKNNVQCQ